MKQSRSEQGMETGDAMKQLAIIIIGSILVFTLHSCNETACSPCRSLLVRVMADYEFAGSMPESENNLEPYHPGEAKEIPALITPRTKYIFFHRLPISNEEHFNLILPGRLKKEGATISRFNIPDAELFIIFEGKQCSGYISAIYDTRVNLDPKTKDNWAPWVYVVGFYADDKH